MPARRSIAIREGANKREQGLCRDEQVESAAPSGAAIESRLFLSIVVKMLNKNLVSVVLVTAGWAAAAASPLSAACPDPNGYVPNCGFETDTSGWHQNSPPALSRTTSDAHSGSASGEVDNNGDYNATFKYFFQSSSDCLAVNSGGPYTFDIWFKGGSGTPVTGCNMLVQYHSAASCGGGVTAYVYTSSVTADTTGWTRSTATTQLPPGTKSILLWPECFYGDSSFTVLIDDVNAVGPLFADGFETGDTSLWSSAVTP